LYQKSDSFLYKGPQKFAELVQNIAPSLETLRKQQSAAANGVFIYRLMFAVHLAEFQKRRAHDELYEAAKDAVAMLRENIAPTSWWAVILSDCVDLLLHG
jgi:nuclear pore complex protein Nup85